MSPALDIATGWLLFLSLTTVTGVVIGRWLVLPRSAEDAPARAGGALPRAAARLGGGASLLLLAALGLVFLRQLLEFRDPFAPWGEDARLLLAGTAWGTTWVAAIAAALLSAVAFRMAAGDRRAAWALAAICVLPLGAFPALTGHANTGDLRGLTLVADVLHVWAAGAWIGGLALVLFLDRASRGAPLGGGPTLLEVLVPRFSKVALVSVGTLVVTGVFASWVHVEGWGALVDTGYGRLLLLKLALVGGVLLLGAINFRVVTPRLAHGAGPSTLRRVAALELLWANLVLAATALLVRTSPM